VHVLTEFYRYITGPHHIELYESACLVWCVEVIDIERQKNTLKGSYNRWQQFTNLSPSICSICFCVWFVTDGCIGYQTLALFPHGRDVTLIA